MRPCFALANPIFQGLRGLGLFTHEYPVLVHTQMYQVLMTTLDMLEIGRHHIYFLPWRELAGKIRPSYESHGLSASPDATG